jgi:hypothetical protein
LCTKLHSHSANSEFALYQVEASKDPDTATWLKYRIGKKSATLSFIDLVNLWQSDESFRGFFIDAIRNVPFQAFRFETPAVNITSLQRAFEWVVFNDQWIDLPANNRDFLAHFNAAPLGAQVVSFDNLGSDARMVVKYGWRRRTLVAYSHRFSA